MRKRNPSEVQIKKNSLKWNKIFNSDGRSQGSRNFPNWSQMSLNMTVNNPKWPQISWKQPQSGQGFLKYLPVMRASVKDMLQILKQCKNNNKKHCRFSEDFRDAAYNALRLTLKFYGKL